MTHAGQPHLKAICDRMAQILQIFEDYRSQVHQSPEEILAKIEGLVSERPLVRAMWQVGYFSDAFSRAEQLH